MAKHAIAIEALARRLGTAGMPAIVDVRREAAYQQSADILPCARWRDHREATQWAGEFAGGGEIVLYCVHGHQVSQGAAALLRAAGLPAFYLDGGIDAWRAAGLPLISATAAEAYRGAVGGHWVTRESPRIDRLACPWFIRRFVDPAARFHYVSPDQVAAVGKEIGAIPFDIPGVAFSHDGELCSFDSFVKTFGVRDPALDRVATIIRGADTSRHDLAPQCAGLLAITLGLAAAQPDDAVLLEQAMPLYDGLYAWARFAAGETHGWPPKPGV
jgi:rhodanese-related sulfurtransferase